MADMKTFRVWFRDGSAVLVDAESGSEAINQVDQMITDGKCYGQIKCAEALTEVF